MILSKKVTFAINEAKTAFVIKTRTAELIE